MKILSILTVALAAGTLFAETPAAVVDARIQVFGEVTRPAQFTIAQVSGFDIKDQAANQTGFGVRFMGELAAAPGFYYELGGKMDASSNLALNGALADGSTLNATDIKVTTSYWSLGMAYMITPTENLTLGFHLEGRGEAIRAQGEVDYNVAGGAASVYKLNASTTYLRPWVRVSADYSFHVGNARPFVGVEGAFALTKTTQTRVVDLSAMDDRTLKSMAPAGSGSVYIGLRF